MKLCDITIQLFVFCYFRKHLKLKIVRSCYLEYAHGSFYCSFILVFCLLTILWNICGMVITKL